MAFLDEKWFYTTSRRRKMKLLPKGEHEEATPKYRKPKIRSRRYPVKIMYLGVVGNPQHDEEGKINFDGRIFMKRVSKVEKAGRKSHNQRFSDDVDVNSALQDGEWRSLAVNDMQVEELLGLVATTYDLDEYVSSRLKLQYETTTPISKKTSKQDLGMNVNIGELGMRRKADGSPVPLLLEDLKLVVAVEKDDMIDRDCTCDSEFMIKTMPEVGRALREKYHWIDANDPIYLVMDNAGGHGTNDAKTQYTEALKEFNIEIIWQVPRSPETNMLDLGVWASIQSKVEKVHHMKRCQHDALARSVMTAWNTYLDEGAFARVFNRLRVVLSCIVDDGGGNEKVESKRGKLFRDATIIDLTEEDDENENEIIVVDVAPDCGDEDDLGSVTSL